MEMPFPCTHPPLMQQQPMCKCAFLVQMRFPCANALCAQTVQKQPLCKCNSLVQRHIRVQTPFPHTHACRSIPGPCSRPSPGWGEPASPYLPADPHPPLLPPPQGIQCPGSALGCTGAAGGAEQVWGQMAPSLPQFPYPSPLRPWLPATSWGLGTGTFMRARNRPQASTKATPSAKSTWRTAAKMLICCLGLANKSQFPSQGVHGRRKALGNMANMANAVRGRLFLGQSHCKPTHTRAAAASAPMNLILLKRKRNQNEISFESGGMAQPAGGSRGCTSATLPGCEAASVQCCERAMPRACNAASM